MIIRNSKEVDHFEKPQQLCDRGALKTTPAKIQACPENIKTWMTCNFLMLNSDKTEVILLGPEHLRDQSSGDVVSEHGIALASNTSPL